MVVRSSEAGRLVCVWFDSDAGRLEVQASVDELIPADELLEDLTTRWFPFAR